MCSRRTPTRISRPPRTLRKLRAPRERPMASCSSTSWTSDCAIARNGGRPRAGSAQPAGRGRRQSPPALAALLLILCGCAEHAKVSEAEVTQLLGVLPGSYDNNAQAELEAHNSARPAHLAVALTITHVYAPRLGHYVYYAQETAADDPRRVLSQKMYGFQLDEKRGIIETLYQLIEPLRWRNRQLTNDLVTSLATRHEQPA